ncbi:MAG TPA: VTT domain-containing protein [Vicinamibacterales bacterium]|nr:VTT domain-containing protein [Vicinamibacterales bacterium]
MSGLVAWIKGVAVSLGGTGLFIIAFLDSSFLSFPEVNDILIVYLTTQHKERMVYYALMTTIGSIAGCLTLYSLARRGGEAFLRKRFKGHHVDMAMDRFRRYGLLAILIPSILPPPMPFKIFVLAAGVAKVRPADFIVAIAIGRGIRYFGEGLLAVYFGERAGEFLHEHAVALAVTAGAVAIVIGGAWFLWQRRRERGRV